MPKELIHDVVTPGFRAQVGWGGIAGEHEDGGGYVQVSTVNENSPFRWEQAASDPADPAVGGDFDGWFVHLDRAGCNRMIRALRRARDSAYGADA